MNNKGFTFVEMMAVIAIIGILSGLAVGAVSKYQVSSQKKTIDNYFTNLKAATDNYLLYNQSLIPANVGDTNSISSDTLIDEQYLDDMTDPVDSKSKCSANVTIELKEKNTNNNDDVSSYDENGNITTSNTTNIKLKYIIKLECPSKTYERTLD